MSKDAAWRVARGGHRLCAHRVICLDTNVALVPTGGLVSCFRPQGGPVGYKSSIALEASDPRWVAFEKELGSWCVICHTICHVTELTKLQINHVLDLNRFRSCVQLTLS